jgi:drug/metabolite transporter (DMT)-like permease
MGRRSLLTTRSVHGRGITSDSGLACAGLIAASVAWAVASVLSKRMMIKTSPLVLSCWQMMIAGVINMVIGMACGESKARTGREVHGLQRSI